MQIQDFRQPAAPEWAAEIAAVRGARETARPWPADVAEIEES